MADEQDLMTLTADIVSAHVSNNTVSLADVAELVRSVHAALTGLGAKPPEAEAEGKQPIVSVRASVRPDYLTCLECGKKQKLLRRHIATAHGTSPDEYRKAFGLPPSYPMVARNYADQRSEMAKKAGLGRKRPKGGGPAVAAKNAAAKPARGRKAKAAASAKR